MGVTLTFPWGEKQADNEESGLGVHYPFHPEPQTAEKLDEIRIHLRFLAGLAPTSWPCFGNAKGTDERWTSVRVSPQPDTNVEVIGFGTPFETQDNELDRWVDDCEPIVSGFSLLDLFRSTKDSTLSRATNMHRPDMYGVWGQYSVAVHDDRGFQAVDARGQRLGTSKTRTRTSVMSFPGTEGSRQWSTYKPRAFRYSGLQAQLRMAEGLFDMMA
ncbi:hypothetical protein B0H63DRAFT_522474 [Podospora didyma]|uniref:Uncharacterized protein n=1 Tax=Podospora didyma TaxID=330526 RepID=A0AAE0TZ94_9PEZI|nr:hypothetical protein B0H63DRAFT_522474 [Podospora didyma]